MPLVYSKLKVGDTLKNQMLNFRKLLFCCSALVFCHKAYSQSSGGTAGPGYQFEIAPLLGLNLPYDLWGTPGTLNIIGVRGAYRLPNPNGAIEGAALYHHKLPDKAYTGEVAYRHEIYTNTLNGFFVFGFHYSKFDLEIDYDSNGDCVPANCKTDSGFHSGFTYGGGILFPVGEYPIRLGVRFYQNPQNWLLLEIGYGVRF